MPLLRGLLPACCVIMGCVASGIIGACTLVVELHTSQQAGVHVTSTHDDCAVLTAL